MQNDVTTQVQPLPCQLFQTARQQPYPTEVSKRQGIKRGRLQTEKLPHQERSIKLGTMAVQIQDPTIKDISTITLLLPKRSGTELHITFCSLAKWRI
jgi:hypothetical protein